jgi:hypothetical protein
MAREMHSFVPFRRFVRDELEDANGLAKQQIVVDQSWIPRASKELTSIEVTLGREELARGVKWDDGHPWRATLRRILPHIKAFTESSVRAAVIVQHAKHRFQNFSRCTRIPLRCIQPKEDT